MCPDSAQFSKRAAPRVSLILQLISEEGQAVHSNQTCHFSAFLVLRYVRFAGTRAVGMEDSGNGRG